MKKSPEIRIVCPKCGFVHTFVKNPNKVIRKETIVSPYYHNIIDRLDKELCQKYNIPEVFIGETLLIWSCIANISGIKCMFCQNTIESDTTYDIDAYLQPYRFDTRQCDRGELFCGTPIAKGILAADLTMEEWGFNRGKTPRNNPKD